MTRYFSLLSVIVCLVSPHWVLGFGTTQQIPAPGQTLPFLEITGPNEVVENSSAQFLAILHNQDGSTQDVSTVVSWNTTPSVVGTIQAGLLIAGDLDHAIHATVQAQYHVEGLDLQAEKGISVVGICPTGFALQFDGQDDLVRVPRSVSLEPGDITIEMWVKIQGDQRYHARLLRKCADFGNGYITCVSHGGDNRIQVRIDFFVAIAADPKQNAIYRDQWHHVTATCDKDYVKMYIDGIEVASVSNPRDSIPHTPVDLILGNGVESYLEAYKGMMDDVRIWNVARTESQIRETMNNRLTGSEPGLVAYWNFDEGQGQVVHDLSSFANHGYLGSKSSELDAADPVWVPSDAPVGICEDEEPEWVNTYHVDAVLGNDDNNGLTHRRAFATIQKAVDVAEEGWTVLVWPGTYYEEVDLKGKALLLQGQPGAVIDSQGGFGLTFAAGEQADTQVSNFILLNNYAAVFCAGSSPTLRNLTIVNNRNGITAYTGSSPTISNCILWNNTQNDLIGCTAVYCCVQDIAAGEGNISQDPLFADLAGGDFHLKSRIGRYVSATQQWVQDDLTSPCIDAGDPSDDPSAEPLPSGGRINMGAYGNTSEASQSPNPWPNAADLTHDGRVNLADLAAIAEQWLWKASWIQ
ncbi:MAG: hypothetical protein GX455_14895 [Phycisphaerae bacterium]|nr:hypothetical protein [Phycisphaerae bacterium]